MVGRFAAPEKKVRPDWDFGPPLPLREAQDSSGRADASDMFRRLSEPLPLSEASLLLLRPAMNAPVLNVGYLPVGPARAAVVAFAEEYGGIGIALGVRSSESGQLAVLRNQESIDFDVRLVDALEPLLAVAERMGFLFDEDMLSLAPGPKGRSDAMVHWAGLMGGMDNLLPPRTEEPQSREQVEEGESVGPLSPSLAVEESQYPELILDDVAPLELPSADPAVQASEDDTFEADPGSDLEADLDPGDDSDSDLEADFDSDLDSDLEEELDGTLEDVLEQAMADGLADDLGDRLDASDSDWDLADPLLGDRDLTEPTAPILVPRTASRPASPSEPARPPVPVAAAAAPVAPVAPAAAPVVAMPRVVLSKFRHADALASGTASDGARSEVGADRSAELARIPIVRVRREAEKKVPFLARLLSSF